MALLPPCLEVVVEAWEILYGSAAAKEAKMMLSGKIGVCTPMFLLFVVMDVDVARTAGCGRESFTACLSCSLYHRHMRSALQERRIEQPYDLSRITTAGYFCKLPLGIADLKREGIK